MAANSSQSARCRVPAPRSSANDTTSTLPASAHAQNHGDGRSRPNHAAKRAVASGSRPVMMAPCAAGTSRIASDENSGKPTTTPAAVTASLPHWPPRGRRAARSAPVAASSASASRLASTARASATKVASSSATAIRVKGSVWLKIVTPMKPSSRPRRSAWSGAWPSGRAVDRVMACS